MLEPHSLKKKLVNLAMVFVGNLIYAFAVAMFVLPANLMSCGTTGIALVLNNFWGVPVSGFVLVFNVVMLALGWLILGREFAATTVFSSFCYPILLEIMRKLLGDRGMTDSLLLNALFGGMCLGVALGTVIRAGASTGGMDIPPLILNRFFRIPVSVSLWTFDFCILLLQMSFHTGEDLLYGILQTLMISVTMNRVMLMGTSRTEIKIVSRKAEQIRQGILSQVDRGVTVLHGEGGYLREQTEVLLSVVSNHELPKIEQLARSVDPGCFMIISQVTEVWGRGFSYGKQYVPAGEQKQSG